MGMLMMLESLDQHRRLAKSEEESHARRMFQWMTVVLDSLVVVVGLDICTITITSMGSRLL
jgi:putative Mn2+ efflux pump MntP